MTNVRQPAVAGLFYPADASTLRSEIENLLGASREKVDVSKVFGIISPHAGYIYSGGTAAYGFNLLRNKNFKKAIIIAPSHREYFPGVCIYSGDGYKTPLGTVEVDKTTAKKIAEGSRTIYLGIEGHRQEHAIEVQIPFLQMVLSDFKIIPIVMGDQAKKYSDELAEQIAKVVDDETVTIASSDLSHFYSKGKAFELDSLVVKDISEFNYDKLASDLEKRKCEACGGGPIVVLMKAAALLNKNKSLILDRSDSGDVSGDNSEVVGYLSAVIYS